jgi:hypothetical protein
MRIREITPFLHTSLYHYPRFESFEDIQTVGLDVWGVLSKETVKQIIELRESTNFSGSYTTSEINNEETESHCTGSAKHSGIRFADSMVVTPLNSSECEAPLSIQLTHNVSSETTELERKPEKFNNLMPQRSTLRSSSLFSPRKSDSLFWSMYIAKYGLGEFFEIGTKYMNKEIEEKSKIMEFMKVNRPLLKSMKITSDKGQEIMGDLMTNKKTELTVVCAFALFYHTRIWVVSEDSRTYFEFLSNDSDDNTPIFLIYRTKPDGDRRSPEKFGVSYTVDTHVVEKTLIHIRDNMFRLESPSLHMKGISNYKITDLEKIIKMLDITCPPEITKWKKTDMYNVIRLHCMTAWSMARG